MSTSRTVPQLLNDPAFWARYQFAHEGWPGADRLGELREVLDDETVVVRFDVGDGYGLLLHVATSVDSHTLELFQPGQAKPAELGWDDLAHWHPYALHWAELDLICRALAARHADLPHPGPALALLSRFAAVFEDDDVDTAVATVDAAYGSLRPEGWTGFWVAGTDWLDRADFRGEGVTWVDDGGIRWARQDDEHAADFYTTRVQPTGGKEGFPYEGLRALLRVAGAIVG
jgi:hypothetical protein